MLSIEHDRFPDASRTGNLRVVKRSGWKKEPYHLLFGSQLTLASAEIFQRLAVAHGLSNGLPPIEIDSAEPPVDCASELKKAAKSGA
jgi:hypothetical protein